ncbi:MAG: hypothetical protein Q9174_006182, partial [Haloplaca sp. 1 TL-2023]
QVRGTLDMGTMDMGTMDMGMWVAGVLDVDIGLKGMEQLDLDEVGMEVEEMEDMVQGAFASADTGDAAETFEALVDFKLVWGQHSAMGVA